MVTLTRLYALSALALAAQAGVLEAVAYLEQEVPRWRRENKCYSCHNNGDGARALFMAMSRGLTVNREAIRDTVDGLQRPSEWEPKTLATVQFAAALASAAEAKMVPDGAALERAVDALARAQSPDGHWQVDEEKSTGAPATYGPDIGTALSLLAVQRTNRPEHAERARKWLSNRNPTTVLTAGAVLMVGIRNSEAVATLVRLQHPDGSWQHEPFDTAVAILGLSAAKAEPAAIKRGRAWLLRAQSESGGWAATTRPPGGDSYAQHISTTAWAALALLPD